MKLKTSKEILLVLLPLVTFSILVALSFGRTDLTVDEAYHSIYSHQIAIILHEHLIYVFGGVALGSALIYLILVRRSLTTTITVAIAAVAAKFAFGLPTNIHNIHPPLFNALNAMLILFSSTDVFSAQPHATGVVISAASLAFLSISTFFVAKSIYGTKTAFITASLLLISPVAIFYSTTTLLNPLAVSLAYSSIIFFILGLRKPKFLPFPGFLMAAAIWTRFDVLPVLLGFAVLALINRKKLLGKSHRKEFAIFGIILAAAIVIQAPAMAQSLGIYSSWQQHETYAVEITHYSTYIADAMGSDPLRLSPDFYIRLISIFYTPLIVITFIMGLIATVRSKNYELLMIGIVGLLYITGFSMSNVIQTDRYVLFFDLPLILLSGFFLGRLSEGRLRLLTYALCLIFASIFISISLALIGSNNFTGISDFLKKVPNNSTIYTDQPDVALFHSSGYLCKMQGCTNNPSFWERYIPRNLQERHNISVKFSYSFEKIRLMEMSDYFIISEYFLDKAPVDHNNYLFSLNKCSSVLHDGRVMFEFYSREECP